MTVAVETLGRGREQLTPALRAAVAHLDDHTRLVTSYHLGWCDQDGRPTDSPAGKAIRPGLVFLVADALSGAPERALAGAVAVELVHNFSLVHDDLMDRDRVRRHRPTVWTVWGDATAVLVGDAMLTLAHEELGESGSPYAVRAATALARATRDLIHGQVLDMAFETRNDVGLAECFAMAAGKTGSLLGVSAELGAILAGADETTCAAFRGYGEEVGLAFQLVDDLLGIWGWPERTGKPIFSDLVARKKTLPVVWTVEQGGEAGRELGTWLADPHPHAEADLRRAADLVERAGGRAWAMAEARCRVQRAGRKIADLDLAAADRERLAQLAGFVIERDL
jgi:geranylgeranyl diphosphate synthase type I